MKIRISFIILFLYLFIFLNNELSAPAQVEDDRQRLINEYEEKLSYNPYDKNIKRQLSILYHNYAIELADQGAYSEAIEQEKRATELNPDEETIKKTLANLYNLYGLELRDQGKYHMAVENLEYAIEYAPDQEQLKKNIAVIYLSHAYEFFNKGEYTNSERALQQAENYDNKNPYIYVLKGEIAYKRDNYYRAENNWEQALDLDSSLYQVRIKLEKLKKEREIERNFSVWEVDNFRLKFEGLKKSDLTGIIVEILRNAYREIGQDLDLYPRATIPVIIYAHKELEKFDYFPDWAAGTYDGKIRFREEIAQRSGYMKAVLYHEYTHVLVHELGVNNVPLWLNEGLAEYQARKFKKVKMLKKRKKMLLDTISKGTNFSIDELTNMDLSRLSYLSPHRMELVYAQSESFVSYIINRSSLYDIRKLLTRLGKGENIRRAVKDVLYVELEVLERDWINDLLAEK